MYSKALDETKIASIVKERTEPTAQGSIDKRMEGRDEMHRLLTLVTSIIIAALFTLQAFGAGPRKQAPTQDLVKIETGFFEAWKTKDLPYYREHLAENAISWGQNGTFTRDEALQEQVIAGKDCKVNGYTLSDFNVFPMANDVYLLTYRVEQFVVCRGEKSPAQMNGSSIYIFEGGNWKAAYRAEVPAENLR